MFSIDNVIQEVKNYLLYKDQIIVQNKEGQILFEGQVISDYGTDLEIWKDFLVYNNQQNEAVFLHLLSKEISVYPGISAIKTNGEDGLKFGVRNSDELILFEVKKDELKTVVSALKYNWEMIETKNAVSYFLWDENAVKFIDSGEVKWQKDFSESGAIRKFVGQSSDLVWLTITEKKPDSKKNLIVALDVKTGELKKNISDDSFPIHPVRIEFLKNKQKILCTWGKISANAKAESPLVELCVDTGEVCRNTYSRDLFEANLKVGTWKYREDKIYFDAASDTINSTYIGIMDYQTLELEWYEEVQNRKAGLRNLQVADGKIYVMDSGNQLFIYKKSNRIND